MIGDLRTRIKIYEPELIDDGYGGYTTNMIAIGEFFSKVTEMTGSEAFQFEQVYHTVPLTIEMRGHIVKSPVSTGGAFSSAYSSDFDLVVLNTQGTRYYKVTTNNLIEYEGELYTIHSVVKDQKRKTVKLIIWKKNG